MMLMASNHSTRAFHVLAQNHPGNLGWLLGPSSWKKPRLHLDYALDNDAFIAWKNNVPWDESAWFRMLDKVPEQQPLWALVPDVVADRKRTLETWEKYHTEILQRGLRPAFAVQDGMIATDVPKFAEVVFVGGTTDWKWKTVSYWTTHFPRVHIGRVNGIRRLWIAQRLGAESCDGTGYFRATIDGLEGRKLQAWLHHGTDPHYELALGLK